MPCASETYIADAARDGNAELADFFRHAQAESRNGGEQGQQFLASRRCGYGALVS